MNSEGQELTKKEFDHLVKTGAITDAKMDSFGDGHGEPYMPDRKAFGTNAGLRVWAWVRGKYVKSE